MSNFKVKNVVIQRLSNLCKSAQEELKVVRLEIFNNKLYAIACNQYIACVEFIADISESNSVCHIKSLEKFSDDEISYTFETLPDIAMGSIRSDSNKDYSDCLDWSDNALLDDWRSWFIEPVEKSQGFMYWNLYQIQTLFESSPSGEIVFPEFIDSNKPLIIRDINDSNWLGVFIPSKDGKTLKSAEFPIWL